MLDPLETFALGPYHLQGPTNIKTARS